MHAFLIAVYGGEACQTIKPLGNGPSTHWTGDVVDPRAALGPVEAKIPPSVGNQISGKKLLLTEIAKLSVARPHGCQYVTQHILEVQNHQIMHTHTPGPLNFDLQKRIYEQRQTGFQVTVSRA